ncbi:MAG: hypothetical protein JXB04_06010 [Kiritimatiellae bacterium]|nr:hypothetical protein [Kiritimatiellia bacterium]
MRLSPKIALALGILLAVSTVLHVILFRAFIYRSFTRLEAEEARRSMRRCAAALAREIDHLCMVTADWAQWDDSYRFVQDRNEEYVEANLQSGTFNDNRLFLLAYYDERGGLVWGRAYDPEEEWEDDIGIGDAAGSLTSDHPLIVQPPETNAIGGVLLTRHGPMLIASGKILKSDNSGPSRGLLVMGRLLDEAAVEALGVQVDVELQVRPIRNSVIPAEEGEDLSDLPLDGSPAILGRSSDSLLVYAVLRDLHDEPAILMRVTVPRDISARARTTLYYATVAVAVAGLVILLDILFLLHHLVVAPVTTLARNVVRVREARIPVTDVALDGDDEIGTLSRDFEKTLAELAEAKTHAEKSNRAKSDFLNVISHELRTPLSAVVGLADLIAASQDHAACREWAEKIVAESDALQRLVDELLDVARAEAGKLPIESLPFNLADLLKDLEETLTPRARQKGLSFAVRLDTALPKTVVGDSRRIRQVLMNLADNALKFTERGSVTMSASVLENAGDAVLLGFSVADTGIGIPRDRQSAIFEEFVQAYDKMARKYGGSGLGTAISSQLVRRMGGDMGLESEEGKGSTFWFTLRLRRAGPTC